MKDHTKAYQELTALDSKLGQTIPKGIDVRRHKAVERLAALKSKRFDGQFLREEVQDHEESWQLSGERRGKARIPTSRPMPTKRCQLWRNTSARPRSF